MRKKTEKADIIITKRQDTMGNDVSVGVNQPFRVVLLTDTSVELGRALSRGIANYTHLHRSWKIYRHSRFNWKRGVDKDLVRHIIDWRPDGIIALDLPTELEKLGIPIVSFELHSNMPCHVRLCTADEQISKMAAEYFCDCGFSKFAYMGFDNIEWSRRRGDAFLQKLADMGFNVFLYKQPTAENKHAWKQEEIAISRWLKSLPRQTAIFTANDDRGTQVLECCDSIGLKVPDDLAVLGAGNDSIVCEFSSPALSSIAFNTDVIGYEIASVLEKMMKKEETKIETILINPTHIVPRPSTDFFSVNDPKALEALNFIQSHLRDNITAEDVIRNSTTSRRTLERRFKVEVGRTLHDYIGRIRTHEVCKMLATTTFSVKEIATDLNFISIEHLSRSFRKYMGTTPTQYRNRHSFLSKSMSISQNLVDLDFKIHKQGT